MTSPKFATTSSTGRHYVLDSGERFMSVTTVLGHLAKFGLMDWAARLAAEAALDHRRRLRYAYDGSCGRTGTRGACGGCRDCMIAWLADRHNVLRDEAADRGSRLHEAAEHREQFGPGGAVDDDIREYFEAYVAWADRAKPQILAVEATVVSRKWGYAGTLDNIMRFDDDSDLPPKLEHLRHKVLVVDKKTSKSIYREAGLQVNAYAKADALILPDGTERPLPDPENGIDAIEGGLILHIRPEREGGVKMREVFLSRENHSAFIHALRIAEALTAPLGELMSRPSKLPTPKSPKQKGQAS